VKKGNRGEVGQSEEENGNQKKKSVKRPRGQKRSDGQKGEKRPGTRAAKLLLHYCQESGLHPERKGSKEKDRNGSREGGGARQGIVQLRV